MAQWRGNLVAEKEAKARHVFGDLEDHFGHQRADPNIGSKESLHILAKFSSQCNGFPEPVLLLSSFLRKDEATIGVRQHAKQNQLGLGRMLGQRKESEAKFYVWKLKLHAV
jgi:hypothetical protein